MSMNFLVFSYLIVSRKQLLIQHDAIDTKAGCRLGIIKQFLQHFFHSNEIKDNQLSHQILSEVHKSTETLDTSYTPQNKIILEAVDCFSGNLRFSREYLYR